MTDIDRAIVHYDGNNEEPFADLVVDGLKALREKKEKKQAKWLIASDGYYPYCSNCGYEPEWTGKDNRTPHCPKCGLKMKNGKGVQ